MKHSNVPTFFYSLAVAALIAGCGGGGDGDSMEATESSTEATEATEVAGADVCALLTASDIEEALGTTAGDPQPGAEEGLGNCSWASAEGGDPVAVLVLEKAVLGSFDEFVAAFGEEFGGEDPPRDEYHPVDGVPGDWAMYVAEEHMVRAFRGDQVLEVSSPSAEEEQVVDLAARAMARLP